MGGWNCFQLIGYSHSKCYLVRIFEFRCTYLTWATAQVGIMCEIVPALGRAQREKQLLDDRQDVLHEQSANQILHDGARFLHDLNAKVYALGSGFVANRFGSRNLYFSSPRFLEVDTDNSDSLDIFEFYSAGL